MAWIYEHDGQPYTGRVINIAGQYYTTNHGTLEGDSMPVLPINANGTRTAPSPNSVNQYHSTTSTPSRMTSPRNNRNGMTRNNRNRNHMNSSSGMRRRAPSNGGRGANMNRSGRISRTNMGRGNRMNVRPRPPVGVPCPPGTYDCRGMCIPNEEQCLTCEEQQMITCWNGMCASNLHECPPNPDFNPGGEFGPGGPGGYADMPGPNISVIDPRVPGQGPSLPAVLEGQCYCECAAIDDPMDVGFGYFGFTEQACTPPGQHCNSLCSAHCSQYVHGSLHPNAGEQSHQLSWSHCYDVTP